MPSIKSTLHASIRPFGVDVVRYPPEAESRRRLVHLLADLGVDLLIDVGANIGQFGQQMRGLGYRGQIMSFEPLPEAFRALVASTAGDSGWTVRNIALGATESTSELHISANSVSSSLLPMLPLHEEAAPDSVYSGSVLVPIRPLDDFVEEFAPHRTPFLKVDTQGYEMEVLLGARRTIEHVPGILLELSLVPLYEGATSLPAMVQWLERQGFVLADIDRGFEDSRTGRLLQVDGTFLRAESNTGRAEESGTPRQRISSQP